MDLFEPIAGVNLEKYAELCAAMADTNHDEAKEIAVAETLGVAGPAWLEAKKGWTDRMMDDAKKTGKLAQAFMPLYQGEQAKLRGGAEPMDLETYARVAAELAFLKGPDGGMVNQEGHLATHGLTLTKWGEISGYWVPKVNDPADPSAGTFRVLMQAESDKIFGIKRDAAPAPSAPSAPASPSAPSHTPQVPARQEEEPTDFVSMLIKWIRGLLGI
jgi:hypothetical protein